MEQEEDDSRRNSSSNMVKAAQVPVLATRVTLQEAPLIGTSHMSIRRERKPKISRKRLLSLH